MVPRQVQRPISHRQRAEPASVIVWGFLGLTGLPSRFPGLWCAFELPQLNATVMPLRRMRGWRAFPQTRIQGPRKSTHDRNHASVFIATGVPSPSALQNEQSPAHLLSHKRARTYSLHHGRHWLAELCHPRRANPLIASVLALLRLQ
jgi:hypothetical protein